MGSKATGFTALKHDSRRPPTGVQRMGVQTQMMRPISSVSKRSMKSKVSAFKQTCSDLVLSGSLDSTLIKFWNLIRKDDQPDKCRLCKTQINMYKNTSSKLNKSTNSYLNESGTGIALHDQTVKQKEYYKLLICI